MMLLVTVLRPLSLAALTVEWVFTTVVTLKMLESSAQVSDAYKGHIIIACVHVYIIRSHVHVSIFCMGACDMQCTDTVL